MSRPRLRSTSSSCLVVLTAALLAPNGARAQERIEGVGPLAVGSRVRLQAPSAVAGRIQGLVLGVDGEALLVGSDHARPVRIPHEAITRLEVSTGRREQALKGMAIGGAVGGAVFAGIPRDEYCADYVDPLESCPSRAEMVGTGVVGGALWGLLIGHFVKTDRWSSVPVPGPRVTMAPARLRGGWGVALSVGW
jgi:hypothetical protein